jgi:isoprenylcysteine carboxyl methyltransferase (ICMT) family protein YpbQ
MAIRRSDQERNLKQLNPRRILTDIGFYGLALAIGLTVFWFNSGEAACALFITSRLAYVFFTGLSLRAQARRLGRESEEEGFRRFAAFHRRVLRFQNIDGLFTITLAVVTRSTFDVELSPWVTWIAGVTVVVLGFAVKGWAVRTLGVGSYTWQDFFVPKATFEPCRRGPYRLLKDPMYTIGYLQPYGMALALLSWPAMLAGLFSQATILIMNHVVEKPHFNGLCQRASEAAARGTEVGGVPDPV